ncbi:DUF302 domain-containing protein [candidate division GN15 bacterium]|nr:DUF302 domain-containing protein [candidate division GN15 bacterium]
MMEPATGQLIDMMKYRIESEKSFDEVVANIETQTAEHKFRVLAIHDVQATLAEKGFERGPLKIIEVCSAPFANEALSHTIDTALFMPCRYTVYEENGKTQVVLGRPTMISQMMPKAGLENVANKAEETLKSIMQKAI